MKTAYDNNKKKLISVNPTMTYNGENIEVWKKSAREKLSELLGMDKFSKVDADFDIEYEKILDNATEIRFTFQSEEGYRVPCYILILARIHRGTVQ